MSLDADLIVDRRRMRRKLVFWRVVAFALIILAIAGAALAGSNRFGLIGVRPYIARVTIQGTDPHRSDQGRGARPARQIDLGARGHRPCRQPRRHHGGLGTAFQFTVADPGQEAAGHRGRQPRGFRRLHHGARRRSYRGAADLAGRLDRRAVPVSQRSDLLDKLGVKVESIKSTPLKARRTASSRPARGAGGHQRDHQGLLCVVQRTGPGSAPPDRRPARGGRRRPCVHRPSGHR